MTCCVAALCDSRKAIVLAADKMIGMGAIESEPNISKIFRLHKDWWVMVAGNDVSPAFDIIDRAKAKLARRNVVGVEVATRVVSEAYQQKRAEEAEAKYLAPLGWTLRKFNSSSSTRVIPDTARANLSYMIQSHSLQVSLLVAGFESRGQAHIFNVDDDENRGNPRRHDIPGYHSIGSGSFGAMYMMAYRDLCPTMPVREALYYVAEGKYFGELASGVGTRTDLYILRFREPRTRITEKAVDDKLMKLCERLQPRELGKIEVEVLNSLHGQRMDAIPKLKLRREGKKPIITT